VKTQNNKDIQEILESLITLEVQEQHSESLRQAIKAVIKVNIHS